MLKKITAVFLALMIILSIVYIPKQSYAFAPAIPAAAYYVLGGGAAAAGLYCSDKESLNAYVETAYSNMSDSFKQKMVNVTAAGLVGYTFASHEWELIRDYIQATYTAGTNSLTKDVETAVAGDVIGATAITHSTGTYTVYFDHDTQYARVFKNGVYTGVQVWKNWAGPSGWCLLKCTASGSYYLNFLCPGLKTYTQVLDLGPLIGVIACLMPMVLNYAGDEAVIDNPGWDWSNDEGERKIGFPFPDLNDPADGAFDWLQNKTYPDITSSSNVSVDAPPVDADIDTPDIPQINTETGTITGWLAGIAGLLRGIWDWLHDAINKIILLIKAIIAAITAIADYLNPQSDNFILKIAFVPTINITDQWNGFRSTLSDKVPFAFFALWSAAKNQEYGSNEFNFTWQPGLDASQNIVINVPGQAAVRSLSTVILLSLTVWAGYAEIRRFVG